MRSTDSGTSLVGVTAGTRPYRAYPPMIRNAITESGWLSNGWSFSSRPITPPLMSCPVTVNVPSWPAETCWWVITPSSKISGRIPIRTPTTIRLPGVNSGSRSSA